MINDFIIPSIGRSIIHFVTPHMQLIKNLCLWMKYIIFARNNPPHVSICGTNRACRTRLEAL